MRRVIYLCVLFVLFSVSISAANTCGDLTGKLADTVKEEILQRLGIRPGKKYRVQEKGNDNIYEGKLAFISEPSRGRILLGFEHKSPGRYHTFSVDVSKVAVIQKADSTPLLLLKSAKKWLVKTPLRIAATAHAMARLMFIPHRKLAKTDKIAVTAPLTDSRKLAARIAERFQDVDNIAEKMGLQVPESASIVINRRSLVTRLLGPFALNMPALNIWEREWKKVIVLNPLHLKKFDITINKGVLSHERSHLILFSTFEPGAFVNLNLAASEALADVMAAVANGSPRIGPLPKGKCIRDISMPESEDNLRGPVKSLLDITGEDYHKDSILMSNLLWRVYIRIGEERFTSLFRAFITDLNGFHLSYERTRVLGENKKTKFIHDFEYFTATLSRSAKDQDFEAVVKREIDAVTSDLNMNKGRIERLAEDLKRHDTDYRRQESPDRLGKGVYSVFALLGATANGYLVYKLVDSILDLIEEDSE